MLQEIPEHIIRVVESGIRALSRAIKTAVIYVLIGESLVMSDFSLEQLHNYATSKRNLYLRNNFRQRQIMFVKICGITNEEDALLSIAGADALGFNFVNGSKRKIATQRAAEIARRLPPDVLTVGIFQNDLPKEHLG